MSNQPCLGPDDADRPRSTDHPDWPKWEVAYRVYHRKSPVPNPTHKCPQCMESFCCHDDLVYHRMGKHGVLVGARN